MLPEELYKRRGRHNNTPESVMLIITNYIVFTVSVQVFALCTRINWFFWVIIGLLTLYNIYVIRRNREEFDRLKIMAYIISLAGLAILFIVIRLKAKPC